MNNPIQVILKDTDASILGEVGVVVAIIAGFFAIIASAIQVYRYWKK